MKKYTCIIVDDETLARELITSHMSKVPNVEIVATCSNAIEAKFALERLQPDILLLDIQMPNLSGLELLRMLKKQPATILTTAYSEHALEGYELDVLDYLLKPIEFDRFFKAISKAMEWLDRGRIMFAPALVEETIMPQVDYFFVKSDYKLVKVVFAEVLFIEALQKYVRIHTTQQRIVTLMSISRLEEILPKGQFVRIHRSYIVKLDNIDSIDGRSARIGTHELPVSKAKRALLLEWVRNKGQR
jgi:two-component system LytT family response regulator